MLVDGGFPWRDDEEMYARLDPIIRAVARVYLKSPTTVGAESFGQDDLISFTWIELLRDDRRLLKKWRPARGSVEAYVHTIAVSKARDVLRLGVRRQKLAPTTTMESVEQGSGRPSPEDQVIGRQLVERTDACLERELGGDQAQWDVYRLGLIEGRSDDELLGILDIDKATLYRLRYAARRALERCLEDVESPKELGDRAAKKRTNGGGS